LVRSLINNAGSNIIHLFVTMVITFIMTPIYVRMMGHYDFGIREIVMALAGYMGLLTIGMHPTISRYVSMHNAQNDRDAVFSVYICSMIFMAFVGLLSAIVFFAWGIFYPHWLGEGNGDIDKYRAFLFIVGVKLLFQFPTTVTAAFLEGLQRFYFKNFINMLFGVLTAVLCYIFMTPDNALLLFISVTTAFGVVRLIVFSRILAGRRLGAWRLRFSYFSGAKLKEMLFFGSKSFVQGIANKINNASDRIVIGAILGAAAVPAYTIPRTLVNYGNTITMALSQVFMPLFTDLSAKGEDVRLRKMYLIVSKYTVSLVLAMSVGIGIIGGPFIDVWMQGEFDSDVVNAIIIVLAVYIAVHRLNPFGGHYLTAINKHGFLAKIFPIGALANLAISIWLVIELGVVGAALGTLFPAFFLVPAALIYCCRHLSISVIDYLRKSIFPAILPVTAMGMLLIWIRLEWGLMSYSMIVFCILLGAVVFLLLFLLISCGKEEIALWIRYFRGQKKEKFQ